MAKELSKEEKLKKYREEKSSAVKARQIRINNWIENERIYNGQPLTTLITRSNLHIPKVFEAVQTTSAKIGGIPEVDFDTKPEGDESAKEIMKALWDYDLKRSMGILLHQSSKIEAGIYGRTVLKLLPSNDGNKIELVDTMAFLVAPTAKNTKDALYCGQQFIYKTIGQIEEDSETFGYDQDEIEKLKNNKSASETATNDTQEKSLKDLRLSYLGYANVTQLGAKMVELTEWYTIIDNVQHVMTIANDVYLLRCVPIKEVGLPRWPFVSWAIFPRAVAFWTPGIADVVKDPNLAMDVAVNQQIDNNTYRNFGMMFVSSSSGLKQSSISPRPLGVTMVNTGTAGKVQDHVWQFTPPEISSASATVQTLNQIAENSVGLSASPVGHKGKMTVTQQSAMSGLLESKSNLMKQSCIQAWTELSQLYADTIKINLTKPRKVKVFGYKPITLEGVTKKNFEGVDFITEASSPETSQENKAIKQKAMATAYEMFKDDPRIPGQKFLRERVAKEFMFEPTEIDKLFSQEQLSQGESSAPQPVQGQPQGQPIPANPENPQLSANGQATASVVPPAIR